MTEINTLITDNIKLWSGAIKQRNSTGRGSNKKIDLVGIQNLRNLVLDLAVRGKLVPQSAEYEPLTVAINKIKEERSKLVKNKNINTSESNFEPPFNSPKNWDWVAFGDICDIERGGSPRPIKSFLTDAEDGLNWIKIGDTDIGGKYITSTVEKIRKEGLNKTRLVYPGDFLLTNSMSFGRPYITKIEGCIHDGWLRISPPNILDKDYLYYLLSSPFIVQEFKKSASGAVVLNLNADKVRAIKIAVPPIEEQKIIASKVDELMTLCDQLEQQTEESIKAHQTLVEVLLNNLTSSTNAEDFQQNWQRIAEHFDTLFTTEHSIDQLKQTILQLAVMGKLVPQNPDDEPASVLLEKIAAEKAQLIADKKITKPKGLLTIPEGDKPYILPKGWQWSRLGNIYDLQYGNNLPKGKRTETGEYPVYGSNGVVGSHNECSVEEPCIVIGRKGSAGALNLCKQKGCWVTDVAYSISPSKYLDLGFVFKSLHTYTLGNLGKGIKPGLNRNEAYLVIIAVPPFEEQKRISSKVEELFGLCEQLKNNIQQNQVTKVNLAETLVKQGLN